LGTSDEIFKTNLIVIKKTKYHYNIQVEIISGEKTVDEAILNALQKNPNTSRWNKILVNIPISTVNTIVIIERSK